MKDLTTGNEAKLILFFALPMLLGNVFQQMYNVVDTVVVGHYLGKDALSAVGETFPILFVLISLIIGITSGSTIIISQYYGAGKYDKIKTAIDTTMIFIFISAIIVSVIGILCSEYIFRLIGVPESIIPNAKLFLDITLAGSITMFGYNATSAILRGLGDSKTPLYFLIISTIINIVLVVLFVAVFHWGIGGSAIATVIAQAFSFFLSVIYLNKYHALIKFSFTKIDFSKEIFFQSVKIGLPTGLQHMFVSLGMMAMLKIVNNYDTNVIAAYSVAGRIDSFALLPAMNFSIALTSFVGQNVGAQKYDRVKRGLYSTLIMTSIISVFFTLAVILFGRQLMHAFTPDQEVINIGINYLIIVGSFYVVFSTMFMYNAVFRGAGDTIIPMFITLLSLWLIRIPVAYFLSDRIGTDGIWWGIPVAWVLGAILAYFYYVSGRWKNKSVVKPQLPLITNLED